VMGELGGRPRSRGDGVTNLVWRARGGRSWLRHCATSRKVAGSIPDDVIGIFL
jgi:hypothetical protein